MLLVLANAAPPSPTPGTAATAGVGAALCEAEAPVELGFEATFRGVEVRLQQ